MKILKRIFLVLSGLLVLLILSAFILLRYYEDDVVKYAVDKAKTQFKTRVELGKVELTFWKTFPNASLHFSDVFIEETLEKGDTLLFAKSVYLEFNLLDLLRSKYKIHTLDVEDAVCHLHQNAKGLDNWHFWKEDASDSSQFAVNLQKVSIEKTRLEYLDDQSKFLVDITSDKSVGKGDFGSKQFEIELDLNGVIHRLMNGNRTFALEKRFESETSIEADKENSIYVFNACELTLEKMKFVVNGNVDASPKANVDLKISGREIHLKDLIGSLSPDLRNSLKAYSPDGEMNIDMNIFGEYSGKKNPKVEMHVLVKEGSLKQEETDMVLEHIDCDVKYTHGAKTDELKINSLQCNLESGFVQIHGLVTNLSQPNLNLAVQVDMDMLALKKFFALDTLEICQGHIQTKANVNGVLHYIESDSAYDWKSVLASGSAKLENGVLKMKNSNREFNQLQADVFFNNRDATVQNFSGVVNGSDFRINGALNNLIPFLTNTNERLALNANLNSNQIDFTNLVETNASTANDNNYKFELPSRVDFTLNSNIRKFSFRKFEATDVKGIAACSNGRLTIDPLSFGTADGRFTAQIVMERSQEEMYRLNCLAQLGGIDIRKLFTEFENFDQEFIQDHHLNGTTNATVQFRCNLTTALEMLPSSVESLVDVSIENGQLIDMTSLQEIAAYIRGNKLVAPFVNEEKFAEKMKNISFSKLENVIEIKDRVITIPLMDIKSSALDISARGTHSFDNQIDYAIGFNLRDVLVRRDKDWQEVDDGLGKRLYISMKGTTDKPVFGMDRELAKEIRQEEMQAEKQNVKALLKEELGLFRKDNSIGTYKEENTNTGSTTTLQWEDFNSNATDAAEKPKEKVMTKSTVDPVPDKPKKKVKKWLEEK